MAHTSFDRRRALAFAALYAGVLSSDILVDDSDPSVIYTPSNGWAEGTTCITCTTFPNSSKAQNGTWHNINPKPGVGTPRASFIFTGTGVRVYAILPAYSASDDPNVPIIHTDATFFLDNIVQGTDYEYFPPVGADYQYHHLIFNSSTLALGEHTLMVQSSFDDVSVLLLDYIVYTVPDSTTLASGNSTITTKTSQPQSPTVTTSTATTGASPDTPLPGRSPEASLASYAFLLQSSTCYASDVRAGV
ncbi:hypothetical protein GY45DRAFT_64543 [Cubamyces sp. BRFM 1775]|nr:hypothetical protein GY45DRAFT_64543 [Cubamyces sp. BRFM 1775]